MSSNMDGDDGDFMAWYSDLSDADQIFILEQLRGKAKALGIVAGGTAHVVEVERERAEQERIDGIAADLLADVDL